MARSLSFIRNSKVIEVIESMLILPLERTRRANQLEFRKEHAYLGRLRYLFYHIRSFACLPALANAKAELAELEEELNHLTKLLPPASDARSTPSSSTLSDSRLHRLLQVVADLHRTCLKDLHPTLRHLADPSRAPQILQKLHVLLQQLLKIVHHSDLYLHYANIIDDFLSAVVCLIISTRHYLRSTLKKSQSTLEQVTDGKPESYQTVAIRQAKELASGCKDGSADAVVMYENWMLWVLKAGRVLSDESLRQGVKREL